MDSCLAKLIHMPWISWNPSNMVSAGIQSRNHSGQPPTMVESHPDSISLLSYRFILMFVSEWRLRELTHTCALNSLNYPNYGFRRHPVSWASPGWNFLTLILFHLKVCSWLRYAWFSSYVCPGFPKVSQIWYPQASGLEITVGNHPPWLLAR